MTTKGLMGQLLIPYAPLICDLEAYSRAMTSAEITFQFTAERDNYRSTDRQWCKIQKHLGHIVCSRP